jgi:hypothetical protein
MKTIKANSPGSCQPMDCHIGCSVNYVSLSY